MIGEELPPISGYNAIGDIHLVINSPEVVQEAFTTLGKYFTKDEFFKNTLYGWTLYEVDPMIGMQTADPMCRKRRNAVTGGFFKGKIPQIIEMTKEIVYEHIRENKDKKDIDMFMFLVELQTRIIIDLCTGKGMSTRRVEYEEEDGTIRDYPIGVVFEKIFQDWFKRWFMPHGFFIPALLAFHITAHDKRYARNGKRARDGIMKMITDRREQGASFEGGDDNLLSVLMKDDLYKG